METEFNGLKFQILLVNDIGENILGRTHYQNQTIMILSSLSKEHKERILIHELTHASVYAHGFSEQSSFNQEQLCDFMAFRGLEIINKATQIIVQWELENGTFGK